MFGLLKKYAENRISLLKLEAIEKTSVISGKIILFGILAFISLFFFIFLNIGLGLLIGYYLDNYAYGILIIANFYFLLIVLLFLMRKKIASSITNKIIQSLQS